MSRYRVWANDADYGIIEASSEQDAKDSVARIVGYKSEDDMVKQIEQPSEIQAREVAEKAVIIGSDEVDFDAAVMLMDDDLREELHSKLAPCTDQEFMDAYVIRHAEKFGDDFTVN